MAMPPLAPVQRPPPYERSGNSYSAPPSVGMPRAAPPGRSVEHRILLLVHQSSCRARLADRRRIAAHSLGSFRTVPSLLLKRVLFDRPRYLAGRPRQRRTISIALARSEEHTSELQSLMRISYAVFCLKKKKQTNKKLIKKTH